MPLLSMINFLKKKIKMEKKEDEEEEDDERSHDDDEEENSDTDEERQPYKRAICDLIYNLIESIAIHADPLDKIKQEVALFISQPFLPSILENFVEYKYFKYCQELLHEEIECSKPLSQMSPSTRDMASQVFSVRKLEDLPELVTSLRYYRLIWFESRLLSYNDKMSILHRIQTTVASQIYSLASAGVKESVISTVLQLSKDVLLSVKSVTDNCVNDSYKDSNPKFPAEEYESIFVVVTTTFEDYRRREIGEHVTLLSETLEQNLKQLRLHMYQAAKMSMECKHGKHILTVKKPVILLQALMVEMLSTLSTHSNVEEVHLVASEVIYIDCNLEQSFWRGKNILLMTKKIEVIIPDIVWDLSGNHGLNVNLNRATDGTDSCIDGKDGENGQPGESAGYCTFIAETFANVNRLTVKMNGGSGGNGQSGGHGRNGRDGQNGAEMSLSTLLEKFDSPARTKGASSSSARRKTLPNLKDIIDRYDKKWTSGIDLDTGAYTNTGAYITCTCFIKGYTRDGMLIEFGDYGNEKPIFYIARQAYCLVQGAPGTSGELGGFGGNKGAGGKGGYGGSFAYFRLSTGGIQNCGVKYDNNNGVDGQNGQDGSDGASGKCGKNGGDVGYVDNMWWGEAETYGPGGTYELVNYTSNEDSSAWCGYYDKYRKIRSTTRDPPQPLQNTRQRYTKVTEKVAATRKNKIDQNEAINEYASEVTKAFTVGANMEETEFQKTLGNVITKSKEIIQSKTKKNSNQNKKIKISKPVPSARKSQTCVKQPRSDVSVEPIKIVVSEQRSDVQLLSQKFKAFEEIRPQVMSAWKSHEKTKTEYLKQPTSEKGYASAFHALFGSVNNLGFYETSKNKRKEVCDNLKLKVEAFMKTKSALQNLRESLYAYFSEGNKSQSDETSENKTSKLQQYDESFKKDSLAFRWPDIMEDKKAILEYFEFLEEPTVPFLISDLRLVAFVFSIPIELYMSYDGSSVHIPLEPKISENEQEQNREEISGNSILRIAVNEHHQFSRMAPVKKMDWSDMYSEMCMAVREIYFCESIKEIENHMKLGKFGVSNTDKKYPEIFADEETKLKVVRCLSQFFSDRSMKEEVLVVETALQMWPDLIIKIFHGRIVTETGVLDSNALNQMGTICRRMFTKVTDMILIGKDDVADLAQFLWIMATYPPDQWTLELALHSLQQYFEAVKHVDILIWRKMLSSFPAEFVHYIGKLFDDEKADFDRNDKAYFNQFIKSIREFHLDADMDFGKLEGIQRSQWPFQLRKLYLASRLEKLPNVKWDDPSNKKAQALYYLHALYNEKPREVVYLLDQLSKKLATQSIKVTWVTLVLQNFYGGLWSLTKESIAILESNGVREWMDAVTKQSNEGIGRTRALEDIQRLINNDSNSTLSEKDLLEITKLVKDMDNIKMPAKLLSDFEGGMVEWLDSFKMKIKDCNQSSLAKLYVEAVAHVDFVVQLKLGYSLRSTQKVAVLAALHEGSLNNSNLLAQIATGEGKTCIVLAVAICRGLFGEKTDVVTSSGVLAQRDATLYKHIYSAFHLTVGEVTSESSDDRRKAYLCSVVYGEASHFERDYLLDRFYNQNLRGSRPFGNVIVDEVDSMFLDKGNSVLYLSHQPPDLDSLENLFVFIWTNVVQLVNSGNYHPLNVHELVLGAMYPSITAEDFLLFLSEKDIDNLWDWLLEEKVINSNGRLLQTTVSLPQPIPEKYLNYEKRLKHLLQSKFDSSGSLAVFNYLKPFVERHLFTWINSAFHATQLTEGKEYVVDVDHSKTVLDKNPRIMILDLDTGVDMKESQWNEALHQFLQLKHGCRLSPMNLKAVFISNISFFNKYKRIFGLTGTIGTESDRHFLKQTYKVQILCVPLAQPKQFIEQEPKICKNLSKWKSEVFGEAVGMVQCGRSVLVVCGTVQEAEVLFAHLKSKVDGNVELYRRDYEEFKATEEGKCLMPKQVIIATNLAGRGTDIKLSPELRENGGLHVVLSYLPDNLRVEQQAFGRAARCGDKGTGRLIFVDQKSSGKVAIDAIDMKIERDESEMNRVSDIQNNYNSVILKEEEMFKMFQQSFDELTGALQKAYKYVNDCTNKSGEDEESTRGIVSSNFHEMKELIMYSMLDDWAYWLDKYSIILASKTNKDHAPLLDKGLHKFDVDHDRNMQEFITMTGKYELVSSKYEDPNWLKSSWDWCKNKVGMRGNAGAVESYALTLIHEPALLVKVAKINIDRGEYKFAETYLDKVIKNEPKNGKVAKYYKLLCMIKRQAWNSSEFQSLKTDVLDALDEWRCRQSSYASAITKIQSVNNKQSLHGEGYTLQKESVIKIIGVYMQSMQSMMGNKSVETTDFRGLCGEQIAEQHLLKYLVSTGALFETSFASKTDAKQVKKLSNGFCMNEAHIENVLSKFEGKSVAPETVKELKTALDLPSRSGFWEQINDCLENLKKFAVFQAQTAIAGSKEGQQQENQPKCEKNEFIPWAKLVGNDAVIISKYGTDLSETTTAQMILMGDKASFQPQQKFRFLRKLGKLCYEQVGTINIDKLKQCKLKKYSSIEENVFSMIEGISPTESSEIFNILRTSRIVDKGGELLTTEWKKEKLNLTKRWEVYRGDILSILHSMCRYKYEILAMLFQYETMKTENTANAEDASQFPSELTISLPSRPHKDFIMTCLEVGVINGRMANKNYFSESGVGNFFKNVFREPTSWGNWVIAKTGLISKEKAKLVVGDLYALFREDSHQLMDELYKELKANSWVDSTDEVTLDVQKNSNFHLSPKFEYYVPDLLSFVQWKQEKVKDNFLKDALKITYESQGKLNTLDNPDAKLVDIVTHVSGKEDSVSKNAATVELTEEVEILTLSGFDDVIDTVERAYTLKMIFSAIAIIVIGLAQIALGLYLEFISLGFGTFVASGLVSEGISDIIYGVMAFRSGQFSWQDWVDHKWRSIAITAATIGIGALLAKGIKYSKFGAKLFGGWGKQMSGRAIQETLKEGTKTGIERSVVPLLLKSFGYKVLHGCAVAAGSMAVSYAYDKALKKFTENISSKIFANTYEAITAHKISGTLSELCNKCGVQKAQEIVDRCSSQVLKDSSVEVDAQIYLAKILSPALNGIKEATAKLSNAGTFTQNDSFEVMILLKVCSALMTAASVIDALRKMNQSVKQYIDQVEIKLKREMELVKTESQQSITKATDREKEDFVFHFKERTNDVMKQKIGAVMQHTIIEPLMNFGCQKLLEGIGRAVRGKYRKYKEGKILEKIDAIKSEFDQNPDASEDVKRSLHKQLLQLCCKSRDPKVIAHAVQFGGPMGAESLQALADMLGVTIIVNSNNANMPNMFEPKQGGKGKTIHLKHTVSSDDPTDLGHWESASSEGGQISSTPNSTPDCLLDAINNELKNFEDGRQINRDSIADFMRHDENFRNFVSMGYHHSFNAIGVFGGAQALKKCEQVELHENEKENEINRLKEKRDRLKNENKTKTKEDDSTIDPRDRLDPIIEYSTENINGKELNTFQFGEVTQSTINERQRRRSVDKSDIKKDGCEKHDIVGHMSPVFWGAPTAPMNLFPQNSASNNSVNKSVEHTIPSFINECPELNSVEYMISLDDRGIGTRPGTITHYYVFKKDGIVVRESVYKVTNPACNCPPPERRRNIGSR